MIALRQNEQSALEIKVLRFEFHAR